MNATNEQLTSIVENIWTSVLGLEIRPGAETSLSSAMTSCVHITGPWAGAVVIACTPEAARQAAALMFGMESEAVSASEMQDALGEIANIAGGNLKALLPSGCELSLPTVVEGVNYRLVMPNTRLRTQLWFECDGQPVALKLHEREGA